MEEEPVGIEPVSNLRGLERLHSGRQLGLGPVDALDQALRSAIRRFFPEVKAMRLRDYKVRVINST